MDYVKNSILSAALSIGESITPLLTESKFKETGVLTAEEFVRAGDHLVHHNPTWSWSKSSDPARVKPYLPADKQFLITRNVTCHKRCAQIQYDQKLEKLITDADSEEWIDTHFYSTEFNTEAKSFVEEKKETAPPPTNDDDDDDDDAPPMDMDEFMETGNFEAEDPNCYKPPAAPAVEMGTDDVVLKTRTYDLHITYDKYYQVPRLWLRGYTEEGKILTPEQMFEDFSSEHANKTITIENHPFMDMQIASIHPCRHAEVMKRLTEQLAESGKELQVEQYLLIFLKFVQAIIPTIEYDYTRSIQL